MTRKRKWSIEQYSVDVASIVASLDQYASLGLRDSIILTAAILDVALAELISKRLAGPTHEIVEFLGADEDGRAPCGSFGSRIQLARLLGIIVDEDVELLRRVKKLRNLAAHRIQLDLGEARTSTAISALWEVLAPPVRVAASVTAKVLQGDPSAVQKLEQALGKAEAASQLAQVKTRWQAVSTKAPVQEWLVEGMTIDMALSLVPPLLKVEQRAVVLMLATLLGIYKSRFDLLLRVVKPVSALELPESAYKLWPSDRIEGDPGDDSGGDDEADAARRPAG